MKLITKRSLNKRSLIECLDLLKTGRDELVKSYSESSSDRYFYSFRFARSQVALALVDELLLHQWIDWQVNQAKQHYDEKSILSGSFKTVVECLQSLMHVNSKQTLISEEIMKVKMEAIKRMLETKGTIDSKTRAIEFEYYRDKELFEREFQRFAIESNG